jgi:serine/threonine protein phosphatase PrpC
LTTKEYYALHRGEILEYASKYRKDNKEIINANAIEYYNTHKQECNQRNKNWKIDNEDRNKIYMKQYRITNLGKLKEDDKNYKDSHKIEIEEYKNNHKAEMAEYQRKRRMVKSVELAAQEKAIILRIKREVLTHYGNGKCVCVKCGFSDIRSLSIDHINGNGNKHRAEVVRTTAKEKGTVNGGGGIRFYRWLIKNNLPEGYQTLCMNCQFIKRDENCELNGKRTNNCEVQ